MTLRDKYGDEPWRQLIDTAALRSPIGPADLLIAHNAGFGRPFCGHSLTCFPARPGLAPTLRSTGRRGDMKAPSSDICSGKRDIFMRVIVRSTIALLFWRSWLAKWTDRCEKASKDDPVDTGFKPLKYILFLAECSDHTGVAHDPMDVPIFLSISNCCGDLNGVIVQSRFTGRPRLTAKRHPLRSQAAHWVKPG